MLLSSFASLTAQQGAAAHSAPNLPSVTPIHTMPNDPDGGAGYGVWAAGPSWKASFHDGYTFYPWIPGAERTLGWQWRTAAVTVAGQALPLARPAMATTAQRCAYDFGDVVEAYDLRDEGVEQTFVIEALPIRGELVVTGAIATPFTAPGCSARVGPIEFRDAAGKAAMIYGAAKVFDAAGRSADVRTGFEAGQLRLVVDADFVSKATLPITIDPLTAATPIAVSSATTRLIHATTTAAATAPGNGLVCTAHILEFSATDFDVYGYRYVEGASTTTSTFVDVASANSVTKVDVCEVAGSNRFVFVVQRDFAAAPTQCHTFAQSFMATLNSGTSLGLPVGYSDPQIGGTHNNGTQALVVSTETLGSGARRVRGQLLQTPTGSTAASIGAAFELHSFGSSADSFDPAVSDRAFETSQWGVAWVSDIGSAAGNDVRVARVSPSGNVGTTRSLGQWVDAREVQVGGSDQRFLALWLHTPSGAARGIRSARYDVALNSFTILQARQVVSTLLASTSYQLGDVAFNYITESHWASGIRTRNVPSLGGAATNTAAVHRHGFSGAIVESQQLTLTNTSGVGNLGLAFLGALGAGSNTGFGVSYSTVQSSPSNPVWFRQFDSAATATNYGTSCVGIAPTVLNLPYAGSEFLSIRSAGLPPYASGFVVVGFASANTSLAGLGMTNCNLLASYAAAPTFLANSSGTATISMALPDDPALFGHLYAQFAWWQAGANPAGLVTGLGIDLNIQ